MAKLKATTRDKLPAKDFGEPGKRGYPMEDKGHAVAAKGRATQAVKGGRMSKSTEEKIDAKANRKLGKKDKKKPNRFTRDAVLARKDME